MAFWETKMVVKPQAQEALKKDFNQKPAEKHGKETRHKLPELKGKQIKFAKSTSTTKKYPVSELPPYERYT